ncbi:TPA: hypothetical protein U2E05_001896 [Streptococcus suis]|nr:hypothetical protein [Streptococcus suis]
MNNKVKTALALVTMGIAIKVVLERHEQQKQLKAYALEQLKRYKYPNERLLKTIIKR